MEKILFENDMWLIVNFENTIEIYFKLENKSDYFTEEDFEKFKKTIKELI